MKTIRNVSLNHLPQYTAWSYQWGNESDSHPISLNSYTLQATVNLYHALLHLRSNGVLHLWVDAVCINKEDLSEKNQQIPLMGSIYKRAREVIALVGLEEDDSAGAFELIKLLPSNNQPPIG